MMVYLVKARALVFCFWKSLVCQEKLEKKKALYVEKMQNKIAELHKDAEEKRMMVEAAKREERQKVEETAEKYRATGYTPKKMLPCFNSWKF